MQVRLRFGAGMAGMAPDRPSLGWLAGLVAPSGLADLDLDGDGAAADRAADRALLRESTRTLSCSPARPTPPTFPTSCACSPPSSSRRAGTRPCSPASATAAVESFDLHFSSAAARAARELGGVLRPNDQRWRPIEKAEMEAVTVEQFRDFFTPLLAAGPVHAIIVGDVELEAAVEAVRRTVGGAAAPARAAHPGQRRPRFSRRRPIRQPRTLHPPGRSQPGLCPDRLVDARRHRAYPRAARAGARRQHVRDPTVRPAARGGGRDLLARRLASSPPTPSPTGGCSTPRPRSGRPARRPSSGSPARSSPTSPPGRPQPDEFARAQNPVHHRHRAAARDQRLLGRARSRIGSAASVTSRMCAPISPIIGR